MAARKTYGSPINRSQNPQPRRRGINKPATSSSKLVNFAFDEASRQGLSLTELSERTLIDERNFHKWKYGKAAAKVKDIENILECLGFKFDFSDFPHVKISPIMNSIRRVEAW